MAMIPGMTFTGGSGNSRDRAGDQMAFGPMTAQERAQRSVFVGNIPYEATEEQLKDIFSQVGPVASFRLVYDRETGKPKGYGFCEYQDVETAQSAMRNLNNHDFNGRPLRVGVAAGEQGKDDKSMQQALGGMPMESPYGEPMEPEKAPEAISKAVASLPPEQMFELMKQMKLCIQNNPNEARNMLLQNPQLAYALLQAQIVMKIVDPQVALAMLHRQTEQIPPLVPNEPEVKPPTPQDSDIRMMPASQMAPSGPPQNPVPTSTPSAPTGNMGGPQEPLRTGPPTSMAGPRLMQGQPMSMGGPTASVDVLSSSMAGQHSGGPPMPMSTAPMGGQGPAQTMLTTQMGPGPGQDFGGGPGGPAGRGRGVGGLLGDGPQRMGGPLSPVDMDFRDRGPGMHAQDMHGGMGMGGPGGQGGQGGQGRGGPPGPGRGGPPGPGRGGGQMQDFGPGRGGPGPDMGRMDPRNAPRMETRDPRQAEPRRNAQQSGMGGPRLPGGPGLEGPGPGPGSGPGPGPGPAMGNGQGVSAQDQEKAALIMQVLQLSDEQISMLPPEQRQSILILKDQIARSQV